MLSVVMLSVVMLTVVMLSAIMLNVTYKPFISECRYAECHGGWADYILTDISPTDFFPDGDAIPIGLNSDICSTTVA
jgi:hypothetical protein